MPSEFPLFTELQPLNTLQGTCHPRAPQPCVGVTPSLAFSLRLTWRVQRGAMFSQISVFSHPDLIITINSQPASKGTCRGNQQQFGGLHRGPCSARCSGPAETSGHSFRGSIQIRAEASSVCVLAHTWLLRGCPPDGVSRPRRLHLVSVSCRLCLVCLVF